MKKFILSITAILFLNASMATTYYVSTIGLDSNTGKSVNDPLLTLDAAVKRFVAGDSIIVRGGTYKHSVTIKLATVGSEVSKCYLLAFPGEKPVFDFSGTDFGKRGINITGSYWVVKGLHLKLAGDNGMIIQNGGYNLIENCVFSENKDSGLQIGGGAHDNRVINCDSYFNADPTDYGDADGFACKLDVGTNNYFYGCRAWVNVDDGWDGYLRGADNVTTILENCWTWGNGYLKDGTDPGAKANGNGFKMGGSDDKLLQHNFIVNNCLAFDNKSKGFDQNNNRGSMTVYNGTGFRNEGNDFSIPSALASGQTATVKNCLLADGKINLGSFVIQESNSWESKFTVTDDDFISLDTTGISGQRKEDGSLPDISFAHLIKGSDLIDAGIDLGLPFNGSKPDIGCFETEYTSSISLKGNIEDIFNIKVLRNGQQRIDISFETVYAQKYICSLWNMMGMKVWNVDIENKGKDIENVSIESSLIPPGIYLFNIKVAGKSHTERLRIK